MESNSSIFNFKRIASRISPAVVLALLLFGLSQILIVRFTNHIENGARQIVKWKRDWARTELPGTPPPLSQKVVLFMGDSKITSGIIPEVFDRETGFTRSYNFSLPGLPMAPHYFMLRDFVKHHGPPHAIVMKARPGGFKSMFFSLHAVEGASFFEVLQYTFWGRSPSVLFNYLIPSRQKWKAVEQAVLGGFLSYLPEPLRDRHQASVTLENVRQETYPHDWGYVYNIRYENPWDFVGEKRNRVTAQRGYYFFRDHAGKDGRLPSGFSQGGEKYYKNQKVFLDRFAEAFFKLAAENGIRIILIQDYDLEGAGPPPAEDTALWDRLKKRFPNIEYAEEGKGVKRYEPRLFADPLHLNPEGAALYTEAVAGEFLRLTRRGGFVSVN